VFDGQCMCINTCLWIHLHLISWHSVRWSEYVYQYFLMNSRTFKTLTQWSVVSVCVTQLVKVLNVRESINKHWYTYTDHRTLCQCFKCTWIHEPALIHIYWPPTTVSRVLNLRGHSVWWSVYVYQSLLMNSRTFKSLSQFSVVSICVSIPYTDHRTLCQCFKCTWIHEQALIHIYWPPTTVSRVLNLREFTVHLKACHSFRWSVYVYQYLLMNSLTFNTLTQCSVVSVCISMLVYEFTYI
jgi:hypothetical protein